ncbi:hypothetical protein B0H13DRAFT_1922399 [Mycena leptocephala]|nr:hypothetical protein B0H13DRAFT_1922399 [Mycena leptocephala]
MGKPLHSQALNRLSNPLPDTTTVTPSGWISLVMHEFACNWLSSLPGLPEFHFLWKEMKWGIFANEGMVTFTHKNVLMTGVTLAYGHLKPDLVSLCGNMKSCHAFGDFNGWTHMTDVWDFETTHLSPYITLYMLGSEMHCVLTMADSIAAGTHAEEDEIADAATYKKYRQKQSMPHRICQHLPDLNSPDSILNVLALRSYVVLFVALTSLAYPYLVKSQNNWHSHALQVKSDIWQEVLYAWTMALELNAYLLDKYKFEQVVPGTGPEIFEEAADLYPW